MSEDGRRSAFLIMPFKDELSWLHEVIEEACLAERVDVTRADNIFQPGSILAQILDQINTTDVVIAVCTGRNPNVFFELGYAWVNHQPILIAEDMNDIPSDVSAFRTELYGRDTPGADRQTLKLRIRKAIRATVATETLPRGRTLPESPRGRSSARLRASMQDTGRSHRLVVSNTGTVDLRVAKIEVPDDVDWFILRIEDELPIEILRPGESVKFPVIQAGGGGRSNFDLKIYAEDPSGESVEFYSKISQ